MPIIRGEVCVGAATFLSSVSPIKHGTCTNLTRLQSFVSVVLLIFTHVCFAMSISPSRYPNICSRSAKSTPLPSRGPSQWQVFTLSHAVAEHDALVSSIVHPGYYEYFAIWVCTSCISSCGVL